MGVVEVLVMVVAVQDCELGAVHGAQLVGGDAKHESHEGVDLDEGLTPVDSPTQRGLRRPCGADIPKGVVARSGMVHESDVKLGSKHSAHKSA